MLTNIIKMSLKLITSFFQKVKYFSGSLILLFSIYSNAQTTYTWNVIRGNWNTPTNWNPVRTTPSVTDILVFNGAITPTACADSVTKTTIGKLRFINNVNARLIAAPRITGTGTLSRSATAVTGAGSFFQNVLFEGDLLFNTTTTYYGEVATITSNTSLTTNATGTVASTSYTYANSINLNDGSINALDITNGSTLTIGDLGAEPLVIRLLAGSKGLIAGNVRMLYARQRLVGLDSASLIISSGGLVRTDSSYVGNAFSIVGRTNTVIFNANAGYEFVAGANPFALTSPSSKVLFTPGSRFWQLSTGSPSIAGRNYATFIFSPGNGISVNGTQNNTGTIDSIIINSGQFNLNSSSLTTIGSIVVNSGCVFNVNQSASTLTLTGNIVVNSGGKINLNGLNAGAPASFCFRGNAPQQIIGSGELRISNTIDSLLRIRIQNLSGLTLNRNLDLNGSILDLDSGFLNLNNNTLTIGSASFNGRANQLNGTIRGSGSITKWYQPTSFSASDSSLFPVGSANGRFPLWVFGNVTSQGTVTLTSFIENAGNTAITPSFNDAAPSGTVLVNRRLNHSWTLQTGNGLASSNLSLRMGFPAVVNSINNVQDIRITLANTIAPGSSDDGTGTTTFPFATRTGISAAALNNTFFIGSNSVGNPLPLKFVSVKASLSSESMVKVDWVVASQINVHHYLIQASNNSVDFETIDEIKADFTGGPGLMSYSKLISNNYQNHYFRILGVDYDNSVTTSILFKANSVENDFYVFPNPTAGENLHVSNPQILKAIVAIDTKGQQYPLSRVQDCISVGSLPNGFYMLKIELTEGELKFIKIVKN